MKRFTETGKWDDVWFRKLTPATKLLWYWMLDKCDHAGVIEPDFDLASFQTGSPIGIDNLSEIGERVRKISDTKWVIVKFVLFQYGKLSKDCKPHAPVFAALERHGLSAAATIQNETFTEIVPVYLREKIIERDGPICAYTGKQLDPWEVVVDHIVPRIKGGLAEPTNLVVVDAKVNGRKRDMDLDEFCGAEGLDLKAVQDTLRARTKKDLKGDRKGFQSLQEEEKEKSTEKETDSGDSAHAKTTPPHDEFADAPEQPKPLCTIKQAKSHAGTCGLTDSEAEFWWHARNKTGWTTGTSGGGAARKITSWQSDMASATSWVREGCAKSKQPIAANGKPAKRFSGMQETIDMPAL